MATNTKESGLEDLIVNYLHDGNGYQVEAFSDDFYSRDLALCPQWVETFLRRTQEQNVQESGCFYHDANRAKFFARLRDEITKRGIIDVLRKGIRYNTHHFDLYYPLPTEGNNTAKKLYEENIFGVVRQLRYSIHNENAIDVVLFINGLPIITMELKNHYTGQTAKKEGINQYKTDRDPSELILKPKRCAVHFAVDDNDIMMCTELKGKHSWFLPFNKGVNGGAGNPVNPNGTATDYIWREILTKESLSDIIENFAQVITEEDPKTKKPKEKCIWPRYHQLDVVRRLKVASFDNPIGNRFLIQHSAGSGKSNSIAWLAFQLVNLRKDNTPVYDSIVIVTDRINLDKQMKNNVRGFTKMGNIVGHAEDSSKLSEMLDGGKKIVITTIFKFSFILDEIGSKLQNKRFAIIIDEAHSSQSGALSSNMAQAISGNAKAQEEETADEALARIIRSRGLAKNANYYAFTATPKNKTEELFGTPYKNPDGSIGHRPFHTYTMKQAIEEGFILDVLRNYTPYSSYYHILKATADDPFMEKKKTQAKLRAMVERDPKTIKNKAAIIVNHFSTKVFTKIGGKARAMVVTSSIDRAIQFFHAINEELKRQNIPFKAIVAFSDKEIGGQKVTEADLNGFPSSEIETRIEQDPYRILVCADKFQTGYDQPLLHTMYVDKQLSDLKAVQTLSRLNRCHPDKVDTFVLDFANKVEDIQAAFQNYYKTTILASETDPNKLNDLLTVIENYHFFSEEDVRTVVETKLVEDDRPKIDSIIDKCVAEFKAELNDDEQVECKSAIKNFVRLYPFIASIIEHVSPEWESYYMFFVLLVTKLPKLERVDNDGNVIEMVDFDKYRTIRQAEQHILLEDKDSEIGPVPTGSGKKPGSPEKDMLSIIIDEFNARFGNISWQNEDEVRHQLTELPKRIEKNEDYQNVVRNNDVSAAQLVFNKIITTVIADMLQEKTEFVKAYFENKEMQRFLNEKIFHVTYNDIKSAQSTVIDTSSEMQTITILPEVPRSEQFISYLPLYSIRAAAGYFGEGEAVECEGWMKAEGIGRLNNEMFVVRVVGHSMEPRINDGDFCVFQAHPAGSRQGTIVLAQHRGYYDEDNAGSFSVKEYYSEKSVNDDGSWQHDQIVLKPYNPAYNPIVINPTEADDFRIVGSFVTILNPQN
jgi:type I restriction enzyme R subunit